MARKPNPLITPDTRDAMIERFTEMCAIYERNAMSTLGVDTLTGDELVTCVKDADTDTFNEFGFRIRDLFVS